MYSFTGALENSFCTFSKYFSRQTKAVNENVESIKRVLDNL